MDKLRMPEAPISQRIITPRLITETIKILEPNYQCTWHDWAICFQAPSGSTNKSSNSRDSWSHRNFRRQLRSLNEMPEGLNNDRICEWERGWASSGSMKLSNNPEHTYSSAIHRNHQNSRTWLPIYLTWHGHVFLAPNTTNTLRGFWSHKTN